MYQPDRYRKHRATGFGRNVNSSETGTGEKGIQRYWRNANRRSAA